jgi:hypothetical protein
MDTAHPYENEFVRAKSDEAPRGRLFKDLFPQVLDGMVRWNGDAKNIPVAFNIVREIDHLVAAKGHRWVRGQQVRRGSVV